LLFWQNRLKEGHIALEFKMLASQDKGDIPQPIVKTIEQHLTEQKRLRKGKGKETAPAPTKSRKTKGSKAKSTKTKGEKNSRMGKQGRKRQPELEDSDETTADSDEDEDLANILANIDDEDDDEDQEEEEQVPEARPSHTQKTKKALPTHSPSAIEPGNVKGQMAYLKSLSALVGYRKLIHTVFQL
jgi:hypothetical protein